MRVRFSPTVPVIGTFALVITLMGVSLWRNGIYELWIVFLSLFVSGLILLIALVFTVKQKRQIIPNWAYLTLVPMVLLSWLSLQYSQTKTVGFNELALETAIFAMVLALPYFWMFVRKNLVFVGVVGLGVVNSGWALGQYLYRTEPRVAGFFYQPEILAHYYPNAFALSCILLLPIAIYFLSRKKLGWLLSGGFSFVVIGSALILSWSRGGWLGGLGILGLTGLFFVVKKYWLALIKLIVGLGVVGIVVLGLQSARLQTDLETNSFIAKSQFAGSEAQTSVGERKDFMIDGFELSLEKPLLGFGPNSFPFVYPQKQEIWLAKAPHPHNWLIKLAMERGYIVAGLFMVFWLLLALNYLKNWKRTDDDVHFVVLALAAAMGHNLIDFNFNFVFNFVLLGMLISFVLMKQARQSSDNRVVRLGSYLILIVLILSLGIIDGKNALSLNFGSLERIEAITPSFFIDSSYLSLAFHYQDQKDYEKAITYLNKHLELNPLDANNWNRLGDYYWELDDYESALTAFEEALNTDSKNDWSYYYNRLNAFNVLGKTKELKEFIPIVIAELEKYVPLAKANIHYTAQSPNLKNAILVTELLKRYSQDPQLGEINLDLVNALTTFTSAAK